MIVWYKNVFFKFVGITEVHIWDIWVAFPCTDLTALKSGRKGLAGHQSKLVYEVPRILRVVRGVAGNIIPVKLVGENVSSMAKRQKVNELSSAAHEPTSSLLVQ